MRLAQRFMCSTCQENSSEREALTLTSKLINTFVIDVCIVFCLSWHSQTSHKESLTSDMHDCLGYHPFVEAPIYMYIHMYILYIHIYIYINKKIPFHTFQCWHACKVLCWSLSRLCSCSCIANPTWGHDPENRSRLAPFGRGSAWPHAPLPASTRRTGNEETFPGKMRFNPCGNGMNAHILSIFT